MTGGGGGAGGGMTMAVVAATKKAFRGEVGAGEGGSIQAATRTAGERLGQRIVLLIAFVMALA